MKTILFYSYSGVPSRSLMTANLAVVLGRMGHSVVAADFDLNTPDLHHKFKAYGNDAVKKGGMMNFLRDYLVERENGRANSFDFRAIANFVTSITVPRPHSLPLPPGTIQLIPAGDVFAAEYQQTLARGQWERLLNSNWPESCVGSSNADQAQARRNSLRESVRFFEHFRTAVSNLHNRPDYLLIDLRSGFSELTGMCIQVLADIVVCLFANNDASIECSQEVLNRVRSLPRKLVLVPVLTKAAPMFDERLGPVTQEISDFLRFSGSERVHIITSDRHLQSSELLAFDLETNPMNTPMVQDLTNLFGYILAAEQGSLGTSDVAYHTNRIRDTLGMADEVRVVERIFALFVRDGELRNPHDGERNVAFKTETFANLLADLLEAIEPHKVSDALFRAGYHRGFDFGINLVKVWKQSSSGAPTTPIQKIAKWCEFDSAAGFGYFQLLPENNGISRPLAGTIRLKNSFLHVLRVRSSKFDFCRLMTGYIQGVVHSILAEPTSFTSEDEIVVIHEHGEEYCDFILRPKIDSLRDTVDHAISVAQRDGSELTMPRTA